MFLVLERTFSISQYLQCLPINQGDYQLFSIILLGCNFVIIHGDNDVSQDVRITLLLIIHIIAKLDKLIVTIDDNCTLDFCTKCPMNLCTKRCSMNCVNFLMQKPSSLTIDDNCTLDFCTKCSMNLCTKICSMNCGNFFMQKPSSSPQCQYP